MTNKEILGMSKITYKYQITIPKEVRRRCGFEEGNLLVFEKDGDRLYIKASHSP